MSTHLGTLKNTGSRGRKIAVTRFYGGDKYGPCLQLSSDGGYVQLNASDIIALLPTFKDLLDMCLEAKKLEAEAAIEENKSLRETIVKDMREVAKMAINQPILDTAALLLFEKKQLSGSENE